MLVYKVQHNVLDILLVKEYELMPARTMSTHELAN